MSFQIVLDQKLWWFYDGSFNESLVLKNGQSSWDSTENCERPNVSKLHSRSCRHDMCFLKALANSGRNSMQNCWENLSITFTAKCSILAGWKYPRRGVYRKVRLHCAQSSSGHRFKRLMRFLLGPCGALCAQIWPLGGQNRARGTFASKNGPAKLVKFQQIPRFLSSSWSS